MLPGAGAGPAVGASCVAAVLLCGAGAVVLEGLPAGLLPAGLGSFSYREAQDFSQHPMAFLLLLCNWQIVNLVLGTAMYQRALRSGFRVPLELLLWLLGAWACCRLACGYCCGGALAMSRIQGGE